MYQLIDVTPQDLSKIEVENQEKIIELTGRKLDPQKAYEVIKKESKDFTVSSEKAQQADQLFMELLKKNGIQSDDAPSQSHRELKVREKERKRSLDLLELELQLAA